MNIEELYQLTKWINKHIVKKNILDKYEQLVNIIGDNASSGYSEQGFEEQKIDLINSLGEISFFELTKQQELFLEKLEIAPYIGASGVNKIEDVLYKNVIDINTSHQKIEEMLQQLKYGLDKSNKVSNGLQDIVNYKEFILDKDKVMIRICFKDKASLNNIIDFKDWGKIWYEIAYGITLVTDTTPEDMEIVGTSKGSIIFDIVTTGVISKAISNIILDVLKVVEKIQNIKKQSLQVKKLQLENKQIAKSLEEEAETYKSNSINNITENSKKVLGIQDGEGDKIAALEKAVTRLVDFYNKGGDVDFVLPAPETDEDGNVKPLPKELEKLKKNRNEIKSIEQTINLVGYVDNTDNSNKTQDKQND